MLKKLASVGGWTLVSRLTGFVRDIVLAATLGSGFLMDAFTVANRLPNHFRAIFAEGAFNAAFVPAYTHVLHEEGEASAKAFSGRIVLLLGGVLALLTVLAMVFTPTIVGWLAPGFLAHPDTFLLATTLARITFPYLVFVSLVTLISGVLNAHNHFAAAAASSVLLNGAIVGALSVAFLFPSAAYAAAWGVFVAGTFELSLVLFAAWRANVLPRLNRPRFDFGMRRFLKALGPATLGSAGVQIALFADTILVTTLGEGAPSSLYYADRLYQLPVGVIGIAVGTVLLPDMSRRVAAGDVAGAHSAQNRAMALSLALCAPFAVAFFMIPSVIAEAVFTRGAFNEQAAHATGAVLSAYAFGLPAIILIRSAVASFLARSDTATPVFATLIAIAGNVFLKLALIPTLGAPGLALATAVGAWINVGVLYGLAVRRGWAAPDRRLLHIVVCTVLAGAAFSITLMVGQGPLHSVTASLAHGSHEFFVGLLGLLGGVVYGVVFFATSRGLGLTLKD